ncbi:rab11 family-interacting protein 4 isoform X2 [Anabrus simplex]|uniref:rab11 family-interacting protein 4 isoform X2 n=1 Tax=Anabrus simplex TaxID=316456 RepID=UPI0035A29241
MMGPVYQQPPTFVLPDQADQGDDVDSALGDSTSPDIHAKSQCSSMSDGEQYECYGEAVDLEMEPESGSPPIAANSLGPTGGGLSRNTWLRTSLRRSGPSSHENLPNRRWGSFRHSGKRLGSNALASQLYRSSSFNSSGRSSTCDTADDMYSDVSLEEDVLDLNHKVQLLQQQVSALADNQTHTDDRYTRAKQDSAALQARVHMLEEQLRESELRAEERLQEEQRRHRELMVRVDREKQLQNENCTIRLQTLELEVSSLRDEATRLRAQVERLRSEKQGVEEQLGEAEATLATLRDENQALRELERRSKEELAQERGASAQLVEELSREVERLRKETVTSIPAPSPIENQPLSELQEELNRLRQENKNLQDANEELQAQMLTRSLEEGRALVGSGNSLAAEFEAMSSDELPESALEHLSLEKMRSALKEQQEVNTQLRAYIDGILLNIVENYPQLLEVKTN